jgi:hypothetical protein
LGGFVVFFMIEIVRNVNGEKVKKLLQLVNNQPMLNILLGVGAASRYGAGTTK